MNGAMRSDSYSNTGLVFRAAMAVLLLIVAACFVGCASDEGTVRVDALEPLLEGVMTRHDHYVAGDETLTVEEKQIYLESTELVRRLFEVARPPAEVPDEPPPDE